MKNYIIIIMAIITVTGCSAIGTPGTSSPVSVASYKSDDCNAGKFAYLLGDPIPNLHDLGAPGDTVYYGLNAPAVNSNSNRLNIRVSTTDPTDALRNDQAQVKQIFCG